MSTMNHYRIILVITLLVILGFSQCMKLLAGENPVVDVAQGRVVGVKEEYGNVTLLAFRAIPYAKPPLKELRFMAPEYPERWKDDLNATSNPKPCVQFGTVGSEDCLYLNVYTPEDAFDLTHQNDSYPVMVYIHGGGFSLGAAREYDNVHQTLQHGVIVVVIQYRLGVIGFLSTDDEVAPGNQGLMDQTMALEWVNNNIVAFNGDPVRITLFGQSAGSASTHYQILSPYANGLFRNAILQSGNAYCPWAMGRDFYNVSRTIAERFDCPLEPSEDLVSCLQDVNAHVLANLAITFYQWNFQPFIFGPRVDGTYIPDEPARLVIDGRYNKVPTVMGVCRNEGSLISGEMYTKPSLIESLTENFTVNGPVSLELYDDEDPINTALTVYDAYLGGLNITEENSNELTKLYTDRHFHMNVDWLVQGQADQADVYMYEFSHRGEWSYIDAYIGVGLNVTGDEDWVSHGDDIQYLFEREGPGQQNTTEDIHVGNLYTTLFTNFAKYGTPTPDTSLLGFDWSPTNSSKLRHLTIDVTPTMNDDYRAEERLFWEGLPLRINSILQGYKMMVLGESSSSEEKQHSTRL